MIFLVDFAWPWFCCYFLGVKEMLDFNLIQQQNVMSCIYFLLILFDIIRAILHKLYLLSTNSLLLQ